ncbi:NADP-dependent oxidoreductase [Mycolicibacterium brumae]|uniref:NADP-dependent oxidoreductase n=2 Tax=Mycolicibacterium brumae TaxID=85968 RepID=A0A2G5PHJ7_9MYCO|nr:NADP-dependent oxidoreductase [Mycolicibacterium brumae]PIB77779.1 NADP-dependent oxidoreductase [Mycolicibacterium brumae]
MNTVWRLTSRPHGPVRREDFSVSVEPLPTPGPGQVLLRNLYLIVPASMRLWMNAEDTYLPAQRLGAVMRGITVSVVEQSEDPAFPVGAYVNAMGGWQEYALAKTAHLQRITPHPDIGLASYRGVLGLQGMTAYCGLTDVCRPEPGQTLVVTAAAGSVGSLVCQIGKKLGLRVIGVAGGPAKCDWLVRACGADGAIDYKNDDVAARLDELCPDGVDMQFENVGGPVMDLIMARINRGARIALCGMVSGYQGGDNAGGHALMNLVNQRATLRGFIVSDYLHRAQEVCDRLTEWVLDGSLVYTEEFSDGLDSTPEAMNRLARGENRGTQFVRVSPV